MKTITDDAIWSCEVFSKELHHIYDIKDVGWVPGIGESILVEDKKRVVQDIVFHYEESKVYIYTE